MTKKLITYDPAAALVDDEEIAVFMAGAFDTGDAAYIATAIALVARAKQAIGSVTPAIPAILGDRLR